MRRVIPINEIAPKAPPCFDSRTQWVAFLDGAHEAHRKGQPPFVMKDGAEVVNPEFRFCVDCLPSKRAQEERTGDCRPNWLKELADEAKGQAA